MSRVTPSWRLLGVRGDDCAGRVVAARVTFPADASHPVVQPRSLLSCKCINTHIRNVLLTVSRASICALALYCVSF